MFSFFSKIVSVITSAIVAVIVSLGLVSTPIQPHVETKAEPVPHVQERVANDQHALPVESKPENDQPKSVQPSRPAITKAMLPPQPTPVLIPVQIEVKTLTQAPAPIQTPVPQSPTPVYIPVPVQTPPPVYVPIYVPVPTPTPSPAPTPQPEPKQSLASIKIISPIAGKGIGPRVDPITGDQVGYRVSPKYPELVDESNYIELGLLARNDNGDAVIKYDVTIEATDPPDPSCWSCRRFMKGTGTDQTGIGAVTKVYKDGIAETVSYYPFHYEFRTAGQHTITFFANGMTESVSLTVN